MGSIQEFKGRYAFLSNFYEQEDGYTVEHFFQAYKADNEEEMAWVLDAPTPGEAKKRGRKVSLRDDWEDIKLSVMYNLLMDKFADPILRKKLIDTGDAYLMEGNLWGDKFWGVDLKDEDGQNWLGILLMLVRSRVIHDDIVELGESVNF